MTGGCLGRKSARLPPPMGQLRRRPVLKLYLKKAIRQWRSANDFFPGPLSLVRSGARIMALFAKRYGHINADNLRRRPTIVQLLIRFELGQEVWERLRVM